MKRLLPIFLLFSSLLSFAGQPKTPDGIIAVNNGDPSGISTQSKAFAAITAPDSSALTTDAKLRIFFYSEKLSREQISLNQLQSLIKEANQRTQNAFTAYQKVVAEEVKKASLPEGTMIWPDLDTNTFVVTPPQKKPEEKKPDAAPAATPTK